MMTYNQNVNKIQIKNNIYLNTDVTLLLLQEPPQKKSSHYDC